MTVFAYIDTHPGTSQDAIVEHFKTRAEGTLTFGRESHNMSLLMSLSHFVTPIYTGINLIMHQELALPGIMHYENFYCISLNVSLKTN